MNWIVLVICLLAVVTVMQGCCASRRQHACRSIGWNIVGLFCLAGALFVLWAATAPNVRITMHSDHALAAEPMPQIETELVDPGTLNDPSRGSDESAAEPDQKPTRSARDRTNHDRTNHDSAPVDPKETPKDTPQIQTRALHDSELPTDSLAEDPTAPAEGPAGSPVDLTSVLIDLDARPEWVEQEEADEGDVHVIAVCSGVQLRLRDSRLALNRRLKEEVDRYIDRYLKNTGASTWVGYHEDDIRSLFVSPENVFSEKVISPSVGVTYQTHAKLELGPDFHQQIEQDWHTVVARAQLVRVGLVAAGVFGTLLLLSGYFRVDSATRGFYSGRLRFVTAVAILVLVAAGWVAARSIPLIQI